MMIIWNREVNSLITDIKQDKNIVDIYLRLFQKMLLNEVNKAYGYDVRMYRDKSCDQVKKNNHVIEYTTSYCDLSLNCNSYDSMLSLGLGNPQNSSILEDIYTFDFQAKYFIEQLSVIFLDNICNEYSAFYINDTQFPVSHTYQIIENHIVNIVE
jgi:hypothetical protein